MINFRNIPSTEIDEFIKKLDEKISYVESEFGFEIKSYGHILRIALNTIQKEALENLIERVEINKELENELDKQGYSIDYLDDNDNNPKKEILAILCYLKENLPKQKILLDFLNSERFKNPVAIFDNNDLDFIGQHITNKTIELVTYSALKKMDVQNKVLIFHSFNGQKDFDYLYNLDSEVKLVVYKQEKNLYYKYLDQRKKIIETETKSNDRFKISGIEYMDVRDNVTNVSSTINSIVSRLDEMDNRSYEGYRNESDLLFNEIEEKLIYRLTSNKEILILESNDTIFTDKGDLIKTYKIKVGDKIRAYPKEQLAENLYHIAVETEPDIFGKVEKHSNEWKEKIRELRRKFGNDLLYKKLKEKGLRILQPTLDTYGGERSLRKFPMYNNDLRVILNLYFQDKPEIEIDTILKPILKSKATYNGTMIVLGRGIKQELRLFLKEKEVGEILQKRNFNKETLQNFIDEFMPIYTITSKEVFGGNIETLEEETLQLIEL